MRRLHRELVKAGMQRARESGKRIGRPSVFERPQFTEHFEITVDRLNHGVLSRRQAAKELTIGYATLKRLLDSKSESLETAVMIEKTHAEVIH